MKSETHNISAKMKRVAMTRTSAIGRALKCRKWKTIGIFNGQRMTLIHSRGHCDQKSSKNAFQWVRSLKFTIYLALGQHLTLMGRCRFLSTRKCEALESAGPDTVGSFVYFFVGYDICMFLSQLLSKLFVVLFREYEGK